MPERSCVSHRDLFGERCGALLRKLPKLAWETVLEVYRTVLDRADVVPGMVAGIQTHGQIANFHPHIHALVTFGAFTPDGTPTAEQSETGCPLGSNEAKRSGNMRGQRAKAANTTAADSEEVVIDDEDTPYRLLDRGPDQEEAIDPDGRDVLSVSRRCNPQIHCGMHGECPNLVDVVVAVGDLLGADELPAQDSTAGGVVEAVGKSAPLFAGHIAADNRIGAIGFAGQSSQSCLARVALCGPFVVIPRHPCGHPI